MNWSRVAPLAVLTTILSASVLHAEQILFFNFNDASDPDVAVDSSGKGNDGFFVGATYTDPGGGVSGGAGDRAMDLGEFDNGAFLDLTDLALEGAFESLVDNDKATIAFWLFGNDQQPVNQWTFWFGPDRQLGSHAPWGDGTVYFDVAGCCGANQRIARNIPDSSLYSGQWNHYAFVKDEGFTAIYLNGELFHDSGNDLKDPLFDISEAAFGADATGTASHGGLMDDIGVWDEALDEAAIRQVMGAAPPTAIGGAGTIGTQTVRGLRSNQMFAPPGDPMPGLAQEWYAAANPGSKDGVEDIFASETPIVEPFRAAHGTTWWSGDQAPFGDLVQYPEEIQPPFNDTNNDNYVTRLRGEINIPESGTYRFTDGVDDFTWLAIDSDKSGVAGDNPNEILIDDNAWTGVFREQNNGGQGLGEIDIDVAAGGEWIAIEFNQGEGGGSDAGVIYWDYDPDAPEGQRLGGQEGFPEFPEDVIDPVDAETMYIPDTHLRSVTQILISADLNATLNTTRPLQFDVNGDADDADQIVVENPDPNIFTTVLDVDGAEFQIAASGALAEGDTFAIINSDRITGTPTITSLDPAQTWDFDLSTGLICFGQCPGGTAGDYNGDGVTDAADIDLQAAAMKDANPDLATFDENGDGLVNFDDRKIWVETHKNTYIGDANLDGEFNSGDLVAVFTAGKYETGEMAGWAEGDWDGDMLFGSGDIVQAFQGGGFEIGPRQAAAAVPEPSSGLLLALSLLMSFLVVPRRHRR